MKDIIKKLLKRWFWRTVSFRDGANKPIVCDVKTLAQLETNKAYYELLKTKSGRFILFRSAFHHNFDTLLIFNNKNELAHRGCYDGRFEDFILFLPAMLKAGMPVQPLINQI